MSDPVVFTRDEFFQIERARRLVSMARRVDPSADDAGVAVLAMLLDGMAVRGVVAPDGWEPAPPRPRPVIPDVEPPKPASTTPGPRWADIARAAVPPEPTRGQPPPRLVPGAE